MPFPESIAQAIERFNEVKCPKYIKVNLTFKYPDIVAYDFRGTKFELPPEAGGPPLQERPEDPTEKFQRESKRKQEHADRVWNELTDEDAPF